MKTQKVKGTGIIGNEIIVSLVDMITLSMLADRIENVTDNHEAIAKYSATPYDKRVDENGNKIECPRKIEVSDDDLKGIAVFLRKCAGSFAKSHCLEAEDNCEIVECLSEKPEYHL